MSIRKLFRTSFRARLFAAFLAVSVIPLFLCSILMIASFRSRQQAQAEEETSEELSAVTAILDETQAGFQTAADRITRSAVVLGGLTGGGVNSLKVNNALFGATEGLRSFARFDIYDDAGSWRYSTESGPAQNELDTDWGILSLAQISDGLVTASTEDIMNTAKPYYMEAEAIRDADGKTAGYLVISMYYQDFRNLLEGKYGVHNDLILMDMRWRPVYCIEPSLAESLVPLLREEYLTGERQADLDDDFSYQTSAESGIGITALIRRPEIFTSSTMRLWRVIAFFCLSLGIAISIVMGILLSRQLFQPVKQLHGAMQEIEKNHFNVTIPAGVDEFGELAGHFNRMAARLRENRRRLLHQQEIIVRDQKDLNEAQIRMLQAQLNPHFLGNTLDTIKWMGKIHKVPEIAEMAADLADILRFAISPEEFVPLSEEVAILGPYLEIQRIRKSGSIGFSVEIPDDILSCSVPKMMLQPLVENAILHGLADQENGSIRITALRVPTEKSAGDRSEKAGYTGRNDLEIRVIDDGAGIPKEMTGPYRRPTGEAAKHHLGLYNVDTILKKHYGGQYGLWLSIADPESGRGTVILAKLPERKFPAEVSGRCEKADSDEEKKEGYL